MSIAETSASVAPLIRILLYIITGWLGSAWLDPETVDLIRTDPALLASLSGGVAGVWYAIAKRRGWAT
jgi:membrane protein DedA with SNARE-associated domain